MSKATEEVYGSLKRPFKGSLLRPHDGEYPDARRIWNGLVARRPGLIARCNDSSDVQVALREASSAGVITAVRCGGHSLAGFSTCNDGLVIDLSPMRNVQVFPETRSARFEGGCLLGSIDAVTQTVGLAFPSGVVSHTGAGGLVLGGGTGWLNRLYGWIGSPRQRQRELGPFLGFARRRRQLWGRDRIRSSTSSGKFGFVR